jgi:hypothetical protein
VDDSEDFTVQGHLQLIEHKVQGALIYQRPHDGYISATALCQAVGKRWNHYASNDTTKAFIVALAADTGIPASELVQVLKGGEPTTQGTWVHPQVAINLAQWLSPDFAVVVSRWVYDWMSGKAAPGGALPYHLQRYLVNNDRVPPGYFSILSEMTILLIAPMEAMGYRLPDHLVPDISEGRIFCAWLRKEKGIDTNSLPVFWHSYEDGRFVPAKLYPEGLLPDFRRHVREVWLPQYGEDYFRKRDPKALQYLPRLLEGPANKPQPFQLPAYRRRRG